MLTKAKLKARESGAQVRNMPGRKFKVEGTQHSVFLPYSIATYGSSKITIGNITFKVSCDYGGRNGKIIGHVPESWLVDLNADVELEPEHQAELLA